MSLAVAVVNAIYFAWTGDSLPSPRYGALTRHGHQSNPGGALSLTAAMLAFAGFCYWMHRRQVRKERVGQKPDREGGPDQHRVRSNGEK
jgi:hypothetical protein